MQIFGSVLTGDVDVQEAIQEIVSVVCTAEQVFYLDLPNSKLLACWDGNEHLVIRSISAASFGFEPCEILTVLQLAAYDQQIKNRYDLPNEAIKEVLKKWTKDFLPDILLQRMIETGRAKAFFKRMDDRVAVDALDSFMKEIGIEDEGSEKEDVIVAEQFVGNDFLS